MCALDHGLLLPSPTLPQGEESSWSGLRLAEGVERGDLFALAVEVRCQALAELQARAFIEFARGRILADELGNLLHLGDPATALHVRHLSGQPAEQRGSWLEDNSALRSSAAFARLAANIIAAPSAVKPLVMLDTTSSSPRRHRSGRADRHHQAELFVSSATPRRRLARQVDLGSVVSRLRWAADDAAIDEGGAGLLHNARDPHDGRRIECIAVDKDGAFRRGPQRWRAKSSAEAGGVRRQAAGSSRMTSDAAICSSDAPTIPAALACATVASLRPVSKVRGLIPFSTRRAPTAPPIMPGAITATIGCTIRLLCNYASRRACAAARSRPPNSPHRAARLRCAVRPWGVTRRDLLLALQMERAGYRQHLPVGERHERTDRLHLCIVGHVIGLADHTERHADAVEDRAPFRQRHAWRTPHPALRPAPQHSACALFAAKRLLPPSSRPIALSNGFS